MRKTEQHSRTVTLHTQRPVASHDSSIAKKSAHTLTLMAQSGASALYTGQIAQDIVAKITTTKGADGSTIAPGKTTVADLGAYQAKRREPV